MKHITAIQQMIDEGEYREASNALDNLLELGPNNLEALKIKASLFAAEGRFKEEERIWQRILQSANDDEDAIEYLQQRQIDYYFTDDLPGGGRRFLAYPRALVKISLFGLVGCISFLMITRLSEQKGWALTGETIFAAFGLLVLSPWLAIIYTWVRSLKNITVTYRGIEVATRFNRLFYEWENICQISLVSSANPTAPHLRLLIEPKAKDPRPFCLNLDEDSTSIKARTFLLSEIALHRFDIRYIDERKVDMKAISPIFF